MNQYFLFLNKYICGYGLVGRDVSYGDSVSRSFIREVSFKGSFQEIIVNETVIYKEMLYVNDVLSISLLGGKLEKRLSLIFYRVIFKKKLSLFRNGLLIFYLVIY